MCTPACISHERESELHKCANGPDDERRRSTPFIRVTLIVGYDRTRFDVNCTGAGRHLLTPRRHGVRGAKTEDPTAQTPRRPEHTPKLPRVRITRTPDGTHTRRRAPPTTRTGGRGRVGPANGRRACKGAPAYLCCAHPTGAIGFDVGTEDSSACSGSGPRQNRHVICERQRNRSRGLRTAEPFGDKVALVIVGRDTKAGQSKSASDSAAETQ